MKYPDVGSMIQAHIRDMVDSGFNDATCVSTTSSQLLTLLYMLHNNDEEEVIEAVERIARWMKDGIDGGYLKEFRSVTVN